MKEIEEVWKSVFGYESFYEVSSFGNVRSVDRVIVNKKGVYRNMKSVMISKIKNNKGYFRVCLNSIGNQKIESIHRLVAIAFIPNPENKPQVNHKNGIKTDNRVENLEWNTLSENMKHADKTGLRKNHGEYHKNSKITLDDVQKIRSGFYSGTQKEIASFLGVDQTTISKVFTQKSWNPVQ